MVMTLSDSKFLLSTCLNGKYQLLTNNMTKGANIGRYRLGLSSLFVPNSSSFEVIRECSLRTFNPTNEYLSYCDQTRYIYCD